MTENRTQLCRSVVNRNRTNSLNHALSRTQDTSKYSVVEIEAWVVGNIEKPLAGGAIRIRCPGHGERTESVESPGFQRDRRITGNGRKSIADKFEASTLHDLNIDRIIGCASMNDAGVVGAAIGIGAKIVD